MFRGVSRVIHSRAVFEFITRPAAKKVRARYRARLVGATRSTVIYTLIQSGRRHGISPQEYLTDVLGGLPSLTPSQVRELLPAQWRKARQTRGAEAQ